MCNKAKGIYKCEGCSQIFCPKHSNDHRNDLNKQLEEVAGTHDLVHQTLNQQTEDPQQHPLLKKIDQWEKESIAKVREVAEEARNEVLKSATQHTTQIKQKLQLLSNELKHGREENDFSEIDLGQWMQKLEEMREELLDTITIFIREDSTPLVTKIRIDRQNASDIFKRVCGDAQINDNGRLIVKIPGGHTEIRGKGEYNTGRHMFRFQVGIISKSQTMQITSYSSPSTYGWDTQNQIWIGGQNRRGPSGDAAQNDIIMLVIDCEQRKIELKNERSNRIMELPVDINKCPFPWQLHLNLHEANTRVRILNPSD
jgi:hypothetical protein